MSVNRHFRRVLAPSVRSIGRPGLAVLALCGVVVAGGSGLALAQGSSEQQIRCMQLQQELAAARGGGGAGREGLARIEQQIAKQDRVFQGTQAAMEDARCFQRLFIFGRALVRSPKCLKMNNRVEAARRELSHLQQQRESIRRGGGNKRRQAELTKALSRAGCSGRAPRGGGLFDFFGGGRQQEEYQTPLYRSVNPNGRYRSVCVRLCDGFYYPVSYSIYGSRLAQDADRCQSNCAAPAELYVYRNPGQKIEQAISLSGSAYMDLPVALKYRKEYVKGCSCKQAEYNPTEIEAANKKAALGPEAKPAQGKGKGKGAPAPQATAPAAATDDQPLPQLDLEITGNTVPAPAAPPPPAPQATPQAPPAPPAAPPPAASAQAEPGQSTIVKKPRAAPH